MPADGRWDSTRHLKGKIVLAVFCFCAFQIMGILGGPGSK